MAEFIYKTFHRTLASGAIVATTKRVLTPLPILHGKVVESRMRPPLVLPDEKQE